MSKLRKLIVSMEDSRPHSSSMFCCSSSGSFSLIIFVSGVFVLLMSIYWFCGHVLCHPAFPPFWLLLVRPICLCILPTFYDVFIWCLILLSELRHAIGRGWDNNQGYLVLCFREFFHSLLSKSNVNIPTLIYLPSQIHTYVP